MSSQHRGTFGVPGPAWLLIAFVGIPIEYAVWRFTGLELLGARWEATLGRGAGR